MKKKRTHSITKRKKKKKKKKRVVKTRLKCRFAFGHAPNGILTVVHPAGQIVPSKEAQTTARKSASTGISAIAMSNDKELIAVAENIERIYRQRVRSEQAHREFGRLGATSDKSRILTLSGKKSKYRR